MHARQLTDCRCCAGCIPERSLFKHGNKDPCSRGQRLAGQRVSHRKDLRDLATSLSLAICRVHWFVYTTAKYIKAMLICFLRLQICLWQKRTHIPQTPLQAQKEHFWGGLGCFVLDHGVCIMASVEAGWFEGTGSASVPIFAAVGCQFMGLAPNFCWRPKETLRCSRLCR